MYNVSFYKSIADTKSSKHITIADFLASVKSEKYKTLIENVRNAGNKKIQTDLKKLLPNITTSGTFTTRKDEDLLSHSGLIQIDFDKEKNPDLDIVTDKVHLAKDVHSFAVFTSPTGTGLKLIVKIDPAQHKEIYKELEAYYYANYVLKIDSTCSNVSRAMFVSYDGELYQNADSKTFILPGADPAPIKKLVFPDQDPTNKKSIAEGEKNGSPERKTSPKTTNKQKEVELLVSKIEDLKTDITQDYTDWLNIGFALASQFGDAGHGYFHRISIFYAGYDKAFCDNQFFECCKNRKAGIAINTLFAIAKKYGVTVYDKKNDGKENANIFDIVADYLNQRYEFRYNEVSNRIEQKLIEDEKYKELNECNIYVELQRKNYRFSQSNLTALFRSDFVSPYNPIQEYFENVTPYALKEADYIQQLCTYIVAKNPQRFATQFKKHLVRSVACALDNSVFNKQAFILVHEKQNSGKTTFCRWLCPPALQYYYAENVDLTNKDGLIALCEKFVINLDELAALNKTEINQLKSILSKSTISVRRPFERNTTDAPRRCSFFGSTNRAEFLNDETGSVRWLCFEIENIDFNYKIDIDINNIWRQAYSLYIDSYKYELTPAEIAENEKENMDFFISTPEEDLLRSHYLPGKEDDKDAFLTSTQIVQFLTEKCNHTIKLNPTTLGRILSKNGYAKSCHRVNNIPSKGYYIKWV